MHYVYGLFVDDPEPTCIYVGTTGRDVKVRLAEHKRNARKGKIDKQLYFFMRKQNIIERVYIEVLESTDDVENVTFWEDDWIKLLEEDGHPLKNAKGGNAKVVRPKDAFKAMYDEINRAAQWSAVDMNG